jgi:putative ABC transport system substrate-binding protein
MSLIERRRFLRATSALLAVAAASVPLATRAQTPQRVYRVGALIPIPPGSESGKLYLATLSKSLAAHGFIKGQNLVIEARMADARGVARSQARALVKVGVDALFTLTTPVTLGARDVTKSEPIVFSWVGDPKLFGIVEDYAKPGGRLTGVTNRTIELVIKRLEFVRDLLPNASRVALLSVWFSSPLESALRLAQPAAEKLGLKLKYIAAGTDSWAKAVGNASTSGFDVVLALTPFSLYGMERQASEVVNAAVQHRMPVIYGDKASVKLGGLMSYATDPSEDVRRGANYLARVLKGENPGDLAIDQASRFEMVLNLKAAKAIDLEVPAAVMLRVDQVIE